MKTQTGTSRPGNLGAERALSQSVGHAQTRTAALQPLVDICETSEGMILRADLPGVSKEGLEVRVEGNSLLVEGTIGMDAAQRMDTLHADIRAAVYRRSFVLSNELETEKIGANLKDGVLTLRIPKRAALRSRRIEIAAE